MYLTDMDAQAARERYEDLLQEAQQRKLIREAKAARHSAAAPAHPTSLIERLRVALFTRRPAQAEG